MLNLWDASTTRPNIPTPSLVVWGGLEIPTPQRIPRELMILKNFSALVSGPRQGKTDKMKRIVLSLLIVIASISFTTTFVYSAQEPTEKEWKVYYEYADKVIGSNNIDDAMRNLDAVASANGITREELSAIVHKVDLFGLTERDKKIYKEMQEKLKSMPTSASFEQKDKALKKIARKHNLPFGVLEDILARGASQERNNQ